MDKCNEISQQIQSKIRKKLDDLNAYLDDELPDYIMIMIANQKTESQMTDSLSLFLGDNTVCFTKWLYQLLGALRNSSADSKGDDGGADGNAIEPDVKSSDAAKKQEQSSSSKQSEPNAAKKGSQSLQDEIIDIPDEFEDFLDVEYVEESVSCEPEHSVKEGSPISIPKSREASSFDDQERSEVGKQSSKPKSSMSTHTKSSKQISRHKEASLDGSTRDHHAKESSKHKTDERRTISLKQSTKKSKSGKSDSSTVVKLNKSKKADSSSKIVLNQTTKNKPDKAEKKSRNVEYETKKKLVTYENEKKPLPTRSPEKTKSKKSLKDRADQKKKKITIASSVNIVKKKGRKCESEEEEETPSHSVGSKVSVPTKKPRLAPHQRANTVLLLKAISEATEDSVRQRIKREKNNIINEEDNASELTTGGRNKDEVVKPYASKKAAARANVKKLIRKHITEEIDGNKFIAKKEVSTRVPEGKHKLAPPNKEEKNGSFVHVDPKRIKTLDLQSKVPGSSTKTFRLDGNEKESLSKPDKSTSARSSSPCFFVTLDCPVEKKKPVISNKSSTIVTLNTSPKKFQPVPIQAPDSTTVLDEKKSYNMDLVSTTAEDKTGFDDDDEDDTEMSLTKLREKLAFMQEETKKLKETQERHLLMLQKTPGKPVNKLSQDSATILPDESKSIYIGNVHFSATEKQLAEHFSICGKVRRATILKDHYTGHPRGFAYLEFEEESSVEMALAFNNTQFCTRSLMVTKKEQAMASMKPQTFIRPRVPTRFFPRGAFHSRPRPSRPYRGAGYGFGATRPRFVASKNKTWVKPGYAPIS